MFWICMEPIIIDCILKHEDKNETQFLIYGLFVLKIIKLDGSNPYSIWFPLFLYKALYYAWAVFISFDT